jgi:chromosome segregation ATPase
MKISRLQLDGFGKFNNREITFREGLNIVYGLNESGKSTVQMFILSMLFGAKKDFYSKYKPWHIDNCNFGGELEYKLGKEEYRIIREFSEKSKTIVRDKISNEDITEKFKSSKFAEPRIMEKQVGINRQCFLKTIFCKQSEMADVKSAKEFVAQKLMNVSESGDEDLSISDSISKLEKLKESMTASDKNIKGKNKYTLKVEENKKILTEVNKIEKEVLKIQKAYTVKKEERDVLEEKLRNYRDRLISIEESSKLMINEQAATVSNIYKGLKKEDFKELQT